MLWLYCCNSDKHTNVVHNGFMRTASKTVRQSVSLPSTVATQVRNLAKARRLSANRMLVELIENGMEAEKRKQREFFDLAERFRSATDPKEIKRLGIRWAVWFSATDAKGLSLGVICRPGFANT